MSEQVNNLSAQGTDTNLVSNEVVYSNVRNVVVTAQQQVYRAVNFAMVGAYWHIGKLIYEASGERAAYGKSLLKYLAEKLTAEFGKGFDKSNLNNMRKFYTTFPIFDALRQNLSWTHYRLLLKVVDSKAREFYMEECVKAQWSSRQLERQINSFYYQRILASQDKATVADEVNKLEPKPEYEKIIKDPYVLEFLSVFCFVLIKVIH